MMTYSTNTDNLKKFALDLYARLYRGRNPVFLCVGSDKYVCDSLAPIVSMLLTKKYNINAYVYGGLEYNINADNVVESCNYISTIHSDSQIIFIDATLGENVGDIILSDGGFPSLGKILPTRKIGDLSILGVVGRMKKDFNLNSTRLNNVLTMSKFIAKGIAMALSVNDQKH